MCVLPPCFLVVAALVAPFGHCVGPSGSSLGLLVVAPSVRDSITLFQKKTGSFVSFGVKFPLRHLKDSRDEVIDQATIEPIDSMFHPTLIRETCHI